MESQQNLQQYKEIKQNTNEKEKEKKKEKYQTNNINITASQTETENNYPFFKVIELIVNQELIEIIDKCNKIQEAIQLFLQLKTFQPDAVKLNIYLLLLTGLDLIKDTITKDIRICFEIEEEHCTLRDIFNKLKFGLDKEKLLKEKFSKMFSQLQQMELDDKSIIEQYKSSDFNKFSCEEMLYKMLLELGEASILNECAKIVDPAASVKEYQALLSICEVLKLQGLSDTYEIKLEEESDIFQLNLSRFNEFEIFWREKQFGHAELSWNSKDCMSELPILKFEKQFDLSSRGSKSKMNEAAILIEIFLKRLEDLENHN